MKIKKILNFCPYTHLYKTIKIAVTEKKIPQASKSGLIIALLGLFCPLFWVPFLSGTPIDELWFDIIHSSAFIVIGLGMFLYGFISQIKNKD